MTDMSKRDSLAANAGGEPVAAPLQNFESPRAKTLMRAWEEGWAACRDAEFVGEDAQNDAFNQSSAVNHCVAEDKLYTHPSPPEGMAGWMPIEAHPRHSDDVQLYCEDTKEQFVGFLLQGDQFQFAVSPTGPVACVPTHWQPLPAPPLASEAGEA